MAKTGTQAHAARRKLRADWAWVEGQLREREKEVGREKGVKRAGGGSFEWAVSKRKRLNGR